MVLDDLKRHRHGLIVDVVSFGVEKTMGNLEFSGQKSWLIGVDSGREKWEAVRVTDGFFRFCF